MLNNADAMPFGRHQEGWPPGGLSSLIAEDLRPPHLLKTVYNISIVWKGLRQCRASSSHS